MASVARRRRPRSHAPRALDQWFDREVLGSWSSGSKCAVGMCVELQPIQRPKRAGTNGRMLPKSPVSFVLAGPETCGRTEFLDPSHVRRGYSFRNTSFRPSIRITKLAFAKRTARSRSPRCERESNLPMSAIILMSTLTGLGGPPIIRKPFVAVGYRFI